MKGTLSSTATKLEAVSQALTFTPTVPPCRALFLCDSRCEIQRLAQPQYYIDATTAALRVISLLAHRGHEVHIQCVPGRVEIPLNLAADGLAQAALRGSVF